MSGGATHQELATQIEALISQDAARPTPAPRHDWRWPECYLTWPAAGHEAEGITLGPYARWLIAAHVLATRNHLLDTRPKPRSLYELLSEVKDAHITRVFAPTGPEKCLHKPERYTQTAQDDDCWPVFDAILGLLNKYFASTRGGDIDIHEFLRVRVPVVPEDGKVGPAPIHWFVQWLRWGMGLPSSASLANVPAAALAPKHESPCKALLDEVTATLTEAKDPLWHRRIVYVDPDSVGVPAPAFVSRIVNHLKVPVVYISLATGNTRRSVIQALDNALRIVRPQPQPETTRPAPMDLLTDLEPIRRALTINRVVILFDRWDNVGGPFAALHEYLCHTHWGEFLRVLAQPHLPTWRAAPVDEPFGLRYSILVVSTQPPRELAPWVRGIPEKESARVEQAADASVLNESAQNATSPTTEQPKQLKHDAVDLTTAEIQALEKAVASKATRDRAAIWNRVVSVVALRLVAASVNGIRRATLYRCLEYWIVRFWAGRLDRENLNPERAFRTETENLLKLSGWVHVLPEEEVENLPGRFRGVELDRRPRIVKDPNEVICFVSLAARKAFIERIRHTENAPGGAAAHLTTCSWAHANYLLAEETLRQGTAALRHLPTEGVGSAYAFRRMIQSIYHGLLSLDVTNFSLESISRGRLTGPMLPADVDVRYRYLYGFLYRNAVESETWRLGRSFGRPDVRIDLLRLFVHPHEGWNMLAPATIDGAQNFIDLQRIATPLRKNPAMWCDILDSLGRSGYDLGGRRGNAIVERVLELLPGTPDSATANRLLPHRSNAAADYYRVATSALKLKIDWLQLEGKLEEARELCEREFAREGIDAAVFSKLEKAAKGLVAVILDAERTSLDSRPPDEVRDALQNDVASVLEELESELHSAEGRATASSVLFRLGELVALQANESLRPPIPLSAAGASKRQLERLAYSCALYWVGDNLRYVPSLGKEPGLSWPRATARSMRMYVRACLRLAELLSQNNKLKSSIRARRAIRRILEHSESRAGAHARHNFQFRTERVSSVLLEAARIRTWVQLDISRIEPQIGSFVRQRVSSSLNDRPAAAALDRARVQIARVLDRSWDLLQAAWDMLAEADGHLVSLGSQQLHVRRPLQEKLELIRAILLVAVHYRVLSLRLERQSEAARYLELADQLLDVLVTASANSFYWHATADGEGKKLRQAAQSWRPGTPSAEQ